MFPLNISYDWANQGITGPFASIILLSLLNTHQPIFCACFFPYFPPFDEPDTFFWWLINLVNGPDQSLFYILPFGTPSGLPPFVAKQQVLP